MRPFIDLQRADAEAIQPAAVGNSPTSTMVPRRGGATSVVGAQLSAALPANRDALQQSRALPHCTTSRLMRAWMSIGGNARAIGLIGRPIYVTFVVILDKHLPLRLR